MEDKEEDVDQFLTIDDINGYYGLEEEEFAELKVLLDECSKIPKKFFLNILELNYLYCTILWEKGFSHITKELTSNEEYRKGFMKIVYATVQEIFDYKVYIRDLKINKYTAKYWMKFYENLLEFNDINVNYEVYDQTTIVKIKERNYFFNEDKFKNENWFFRFYKNLEEIMRALNHSIFYFHVKDDFIMARVKQLSMDFKDMVTKEVYGSIFYMFMRDDKFFLDHFHQEIKRHHYFIQDFQEMFDVIKEEF